MAPPLRQIIAELGFKLDTKPLEQAKTGLGRIAGAWRVFAGVVAAGAVARGINSFVQSMAQAGDQLARTGESLGLSTRQVAQWRDAFARAGGEAEQFSDSYKTFAKFIEDARKGGEDQIRSLRRLGVTLRDNRGRLKDTSKLYEESVLGLGQIENAARRATVAEQAFGGAGLTLVRIGLAGRDALEEQRAAFTRLYGGAAFDEYIKRSQDQQKATKQLSSAFTAIKQAIVSALLPSFTWMTRMISRVTEWFTRLTRGTKIFETALLLLKVAVGVLGAILLTAFAPALIFLAKIAAIVGVVILVVEDLWQMFTGGKSAIAGAIDAIFGMGTAKTVVESVTAAAETLWDVIKAVGSALLNSRQHLTLFGEAVGEALYDLPETLSGVMQAIKDVFSDLWTGLGAAVDNVLLAIERGAQRVIAQVESVLAPVRELYNDTADLLGLGDDEAENSRGRTVPISDVPSIGREVRARFVARELPIGAAGSRPTIGAGRAGASQVRVQQPVTINVNGSGDPGAVGDAVRRAIEDHSRSGLEFARDLFLGIPGTSSG